MLYLPHVRDNKPKQAQVKKFKRFSKEGLDKVKKACIIDSVQGRETKALATVLSFTVAYYITCL